MEMQVFLQADATSVLGIPYGSSGARRFWNLKNCPELITRVPELQDWPPLQEFVRLVNRPQSRFGTLGCEKWIKEQRLPNGLTHEAGLYVDIVFDTLELATHANYEALTQSLRERGKALAAKNQNSNLTIIRIEPKRVVFYELDATRWMMGAWVYGAGVGEAMAVAYRDRGLDELRFALDEASARIEQELGRQGTFVFSTI